LFCIKSRRIGAKLSGGNKVFINQGRKEISWWIVQEGKWQRLRRREEYGLVL
jgi:hypothetical protein